MSDPRVRLQLTSADARVLRRAAGLALVAGGVWAIGGPGWAAIVSGILVMEPWRTS